MKVAIVHNRFGPTTRGGAEAVAARQADELRRDGHSVAVVTCAAEVSGFRQVEDELWTYSPPNLSSFLSLSTLAYPLRFLWHAIDTLSPLAVADWQDWLNTHKPDLIITHNLKGLGLAASRVFAAGPWKWEHVCHDVQLLLPSGLMMYGKEYELDSLTSKTYQALCRNLFRKASRVSFPSQWLLDLHRSRGFFSNAELIKTGATSPLPEGGLRGVGGKPLKLLFSGQVAEHKGINWLVGHWSEIRESLGNATLTIAGDGPEMAKLQAATASDESVIWLGYLNQTDLRETMLGQDVLVVPSLCYENIPVVIGQAYAAGMSVVASRIGGIPEVVPAERTFEPGSVQEFMVAVHLSQR